MFSVEVQHGVIRYGSESGTTLENLDQVKGFIAAQGGILDRAARRVIVYSEDRLSNKDFESLFDFRPEHNRFPIDAILFGD
jgi:hypothetical protein